MAVTREFAPRLMPAPQAAHYLGVSETMLRDLKLPRRKIGAKRLYDRNDLDAYATGLDYEEGAVALDTMASASKSKGPKQWA